MTRIEVLGPLRVWDDDGTEVPVRGSLQRRLLAALVLDRGSVVSVDRLTELLWPDGDAPPGAAPLQSHLFRLRRRLPDLEIEQRPPGYVLHLDEAALDVDRFERDVSAALAEALEEPHAALTGLDDALTIWRGTPYADLADADDGRIEIERLVELHRRAKEERFDRLVRLGRSPEAVGDLEAFVAREPLRERARSVLMDAMVAAGRRADALRVFDDYRRRLADELGVAPSPELRAQHEALLAQDDRDMAAGVRPDVGVGGSSGAGPVGAVADAPVGPSGRRAAGASLPRSPSSFVGRGDLVAQVAGLVDKARLVTLLGPGGVGKTRLAVEVASRARDAFTDEVIFCDLSTVASTEVTVAVAAAVGFETRSGVDDVVRLAEVLRTDHRLLLLDNCEHVVDAAAALVEGLLARTEGIVVLATSRERLAVAGEHLVVVPPLSCTPDASGWRSEATELLADRIRATAPEAMVGIDPQELASLCATLDGLPLAIELAAARLHSLSIADVRDGLDRSVSILRGGRTPATRHRSVTAALDWSYALLDDDGRAALHGAAVFAGPFGADDLAAVLDIDDAQARELLAGLVESSLARRVGPDVALLYIVRRFALDRTAPEHLAELRLRHARRTMTRAEQLVARFAVALDDAPVIGCERLLPDVRDALTTAIAAEDADTALRTVVALRDIAVSAMYPEAVRWGEPAAELGDRLGHPLAPDGYAAAALGAWKRGDLAEMAQLLDRAQTSAARLGLDDSFGVLGTVGTLDLAHGRLLEGAEALRRALDCLGPTGHPLRRAETGAAMAICLAYGHDGRAIAEADRFVTGLGPDAGLVAQAWAWYGAGECRLDEDPAGARERLARAVALARAGGGSFVVGVAGASLASLDVRSGAVVSAIEQYRWLLPLWLRAGVRSPFWTAMRSVTELVVTIGADEVAARLLGAVLAPTSGHDVFGDDDRRLADLRVGLIERMGVERFERALAVGAELDDAAAAAEATAAFDAYEDAGRDPAPA